MSELRARPLEQLYGSSLSVNDAMFLDHRHSIITTPWHHSALHNSNATAPRPPHGLCRGVIVFMVQPIVCVGALQTMLPIFFYIVIQSCYCGVTWRGVWWEEGMCVWSAWHWGRERQEVSDVWHQGGDCGDRQGKHTCRDLQKLLQQDFLYALIQPRDLYQLFSVWFL